MSAGPCKIGGCWVKPSGDHTGFGCQCDCHKTEQRENMTDLNAKPCSTAHCQLEYERGFKKCHAQAEEILEKALKEFVEQGMCWEPEWDKKMNLKGDDIIEAEIICKECPYCKAKEALSAWRELQEEK